ncbi:MAG: hypothetical protein ACI8P0_006628 [Planctomycetaceae bacterium]
MPTVSELHQDAITALTAGRHREALLLFRQAARDAEQLGDRAAWFQELVWAADCAAQIGDVPQAQRLLLEARAGEPPDRPNYEAMVLRLRSLDTAIGINCELPRLLDYLEDLRSFAHEHPVPPADLEYFAARIEADRGNFANALDGFERAWQTYVPPKGYIKESHADWCIRCCLALRDANAAHQWITVLEGVESSFYNERKLLAARHSLHLGLFEAEAFPKLHARLREYEDAAAINDDSEGQDECQFARVRVHMLNPDGGDPADRSHPARQALTRRLNNRWSIHARFDCRLLFLDYRLAALRFAAGIEAVDDLYYTKPQQVPDRITPLDRKVFTKRLQKARAALGWALAYARKLDTGLECDWRQAAVNQRRDRIAQIEQAVTSSDAG